MKKVLTTALCSIALTTSAVHAEGWSFGARTSTLGNGIELTHAFTPKFNARVGYQTFGYEGEQTIDDIAYQAAINLDSIAFNTDWHPFANGFRMTAGVLFNDNKITGSATHANPQQITIGNNTYSTADISANAAISFNKSAPYLGLGYDRTSKRYQGLSFTADFGVVFQGSPKVDLYVTQTENSLLTPQQLAQLNNVDIDAEIAQIESDLASYDMWPMASIGLTYAF